MFLKTTLAALAALATFTFVGAENDLSDSNTAYDETKRVRRILEQSVIEAGQFFDKDSAHDNWRSERRTSVYYYTLKGQQNAEDGKPLTQVQQEYVDKVEERLSIIEKQEGVTLFGNTVDLEHKFGAPRSSVLDREDLDEVLEKERIAYLCCFGKRKGEFIDRPPAYFSVSSFTKEAFLQQIPILSTSDDELCADFSDLPMDPGFITRLVRESTAVPFEVDAALACDAEAVEDSETYRPLLEFFRGITRIDSKREMNELAAGNENTLFIFLGGPFDEIDYVEAMEMVNRYSTEWIENGLPVHIVEDNLELYREIGGHRLPGAVFTHEFGKPGTWRIMPTDIFKGYDEETETRNFLDVFIQAEEETFKPHENEILMRQLILDELEERITNSGVTRQEAIAAMKRSFDAAAPPEDVLEL